MWVRTRIYYRVHTQVIWLLQGQVWSRWHWLCGFIIIALSESTYTIIHQWGNVNEARWISTATMQLRLYAMYNKSRTIVVLLTTFFLASIGCTLGLILELVSREKGELCGSFPGGGCRGLTIC